MTGSHDADRIVPWWSFTKTVLAAAALVLVCDGVIGLDEPVSRRPYTLRHLLQHRSGLSNYGGFPAYHEAVARDEEPWPVPVLLDRLDAERLRYPAGEGWDYSNIGYLVVRQLIETLSGESLDAALRRLVFGPLGIESARVAQERADLDGVAMGAAQTYHPGWVYHGLVVGSAHDAALLLHRLMSGSLLSPQSLEEMLTAYVLPGPVPDRPWAVPGYGLGLMIGQTTGSASIAGHTGGGPGSSIAVYCDLQGVRARTVAFFAMSEDGGSVEERAFGSLAG